MIREAIVVDNNDPDKKGKVKVRIMPEMETFSEDVLPWIGIYTMSMGSSDSSFIHDVLEENSLIRVLIEDWPYLRKVRYISNDYVEGLYAYDLFSSVNISELGSQTYPQPNFKAYKDGTIEFHNSESGEHGIFYKDGGYYLVDSSGNTFLNTNTGKLKVYNSTAQLKTILKSLQEVLLDLVTPLRILDGEGRPCTFSNASTDLPKVQQVLVDLNNLMGD